MNRQSRAVTRAGIGDLARGLRAGPAGIATTPDLYSHVMPGMQAAVAQGVDAAIRTALEH